jgi:protein-tyrosine-phosphatase
MAGAMFAKLDAELRITTAGTHVIEGQPMSWRTRDAMGALGYEAPGHRSRQLTDVHVEGADLVIALAVEHVTYVRRTHPEAAWRTGTLRRLVRDLPGGPAPLAERVASLDLASVRLEPWEDVTDPAGGDIDDFHACAQEIESLITQLAPRVR